MRLVMLVLALAACGDVDRTFECATDAQCEGGTCETTRYCSFTDGVCASGRRYDEYAGDGLGGACVPEDQQVPGCPSSYMQIAGQPSSYRYASTPADWLVAELDCEDDGNGTHLAVVDSIDENMVLDTLMAGEDAYWLGISDRRVEGTYRTVTDNLQMLLPWDDLEPTGAAEDCVYAEDTDFVDSDCATARAYICECDGRAAVPGAY